MSVEGPPGRGDRVAFPGAGLLPDPQPVQFGLEGGPVYDGGPSAPAAPATTLPLAG
jgi:hypothetical protein